MKFREHKGGLDESMATCIDLADYDALLAHLKSLLRPWQGALQEDVTPESVRVELYSGADDRIGWKQTWMVTLRGYGVLGFTDMPPHSADSVNESP